MHILLPTDVFPPKCGGAGWSSHALALALIARGHTVTAIVPGAGGGVTHENVLGVPTVRFGYRAPSIPFVKNYFRHERLWGRFASTIVAAAEQEPGARSQEPGMREACSRTEFRPIARRFSAGEATIIHAQHVQAAPAAVLAGKRLGVPVVVTVRDHWPWDYFATGLHGNRVPYSSQSWAALATDLVAREGPLRGVLALPAIGYVQAHLRRRQAFLRQADAVVAVSGYIAERLNRIVAAERIHIIPNMVDLVAIDATITTPQTLVEGRFLLFVGKLDRNKGAHLLIDIFREMHRLGQPFVSNRQPLTLVIAGNGPLQPALERELAALGVPTRFLDWTEHNDVLRLMAQCELLLFPSAWGEPLSRVWLEAAACAAPMLAMPTGGIHDIIEDNVNGALAATPTLFAQRMSALLADPEQRQRLGAAARATAAAHFSTEHVIGQVETLYTALCASVEGEHTRRPT